MEGTKRVLSERALSGAGGLEAVTDLLANLPDTTGMAFVFIQHLSPDHPSLLTEILTHKTPLTVVEAEEGLPVQPDHLFILPAGVTGTLREGVLHLERREAESHPPTTIDWFLQSLADEQANAVAILLSGTGSDGAEGVRAVKLAGGVVFAQDPASAQFGEMPNQAIATGCVDFVLPPAEIARHLARLAQHPYLCPNGAPSGEVPAPGSIPLPVPDADPWRPIFRGLRSATGIDFSNYKGATLRRRLERRMALHQMTDVMAYAQRIQDDLAEAQALADDFLIRVTRFFREPETFSTLEQRVFPQLLRDGSDAEPVRIWVPGCASGEEVYSLAISLCETVEDDAMLPPLQFFGTDVSERAIDQARAGRYPDGIAADVSAERLQRFFVKRDSDYQISKAIRERCIFARQNVLADPPFSRMSLVSCRNLLIYFDPILQRQALTLFRYALKPGGILVLGSAETVGQATEDFEVIDARHRLYRRKAGCSPLPVLGPTTAARATRMPLAPLPRSTPPVLADRARQESDRILLARYTPASVVVDAALNIVQFRGHTAPYLEHRPGAPSFNLQKLVPPQLLIALTAAMEEAQQAGMPVRQDTRIERADRFWPVHFEIVPLPASDGEPAHFLIVFQETPEPEHAPLRAGGFWKALWNRWRTGKTEAAADEQTAALQALGRELQASRYALLKTQDEQAAFQEQLNAAHEELVSANEELQSTNEELESAKEELQAANEELSTTNDELRHRNRELNDTNENLQRARDYADTIIDTIREGLLVLDGELRVRRANRTFYRLFKTRPEETQDEFLFTLGDGQWNIPQLETLLKTVRREKNTIQDYEVTHDFPGLGTRTMLLNAHWLAGTAPDEPQILLAFEDITSRKQAETQLHEDDRHKDEFLAMLGHELRNPLAPIRNAVQVMRVVGLTDPKLDWAREVIDRQVQQLTGLVDDLLDAARIRQNKIVLKPVRLDLAAIVRNVIEISQPLVNANQQELRVAVSPTLPPWKVTHSGWPKRSATCC